MDEKLRVAELDFERTVNEACNFIRGIVDQSGAQGVVIGLSGGVDSSVTVALSVRALSKERVLGLFLPTSFTPKQDQDDAHELAEQLGIRTEDRCIHAISEAFLTTMSVDQQDPENRMAIANLRARIRMVILYYYANAHNYLVVGPSDRSELLIGFFTKYGDGGADFLPISHLYKTQVRALATFLGIPEKVAYKPSSPQLYPGHKLSDELPLDYKDLDPVLVGLFDKKLTPPAVSRLTKVPLMIVEDILHRFKASEHKRSLPPMISSNH
jgi:NAD+ synthase